MRIVGRLRRAGGCGEASIIQSSHLRNLVADIDDSRQRCRRKRPGVWVYRTGRFEITKGQTDMTDETLCESCTSKPATIDGRWCSRRCRFVGLRELATAPGPAEIAKRKAAIQAEWNSATERRRQYGSYGDGDTTDDEWTVPVVTFGTLD